MKYIVKLDQQRVIAWAVVRDSEEGGIQMQPVLLPMDPRDQGESLQGHYVEVTAMPDSVLEDRIKPWQVESVIPAVGTSAMFLVLCDADGKPITEARGKTGYQRVEYPIGFHTQGTDYTDLYEQWRKEEEEKVNHEENEDYSCFSWYLERQQ